MNIGASDIICDPLMVHIVSILLKTNLNFIQNVIIWAPSQHMELDADLQSEAPIAAWLFYIIV